MQEIEVGEYVRTKFGEITTIKEGQTASGRYFYAKDKIFDGLEKSNCIRWSSITKHSKNVIDLIEDGDYLNGYLVRKINGELCNFDLNVMEWIPLKNIDIFESLVTHEQFESIEYKI